MPTLNQMCAGILLKEEVEPKVQPRNGAGVLDETYHLFFPDSFAKVRADGIADWGIAVWFEEVSKNGPQVEKVATLVHNQEDKVMSIRYAQRAEMAHFVRILCHHDELAKKALLLFKTLLHFVRVDLQQGGATALSLPKNTFQQTPFFESIAHRFSEVGLSVSSKDDDAVQRLDELLSWSAVNTDRVDVYAAGPNVNTLLAPSD